MGRTNINRSSRTIFYRSTMAALILLASTPCFAQIEKHAKAVTPVVVNSTLETLSSEQNKQHLRELVDVIGVEKSSKEVAQQAIAGAVTALSNPELAALVHQISARLVGEVMRAMAESVASDLGPALRQEWQATIEAGLGTETRAELSAAGGEAVLAMSAALADGIERDIAPASASAFREEIAPQLRTAIEVELMPALAEGSRVMAREAMLGVNDALQGELGSTLQMAYAEAVARLEHNLNEGRGDAEAFFAAVATILAIGLIGVAILWRREANSAAGGEGAAAMLNDALRRQGKPHNAADVLNAIQSLDKTEQVKLYQHLAEAIQTGEH